MTPKRKKRPSPNNDTKIVAIVLSLFVAGVILFFFLSRPKEFNNAKTPAPNEAGDRYLPSENLKPVELRPPHPLKPGVFKAIPGSGGKIAIIIDDWGQTTANCKYLKEIPEPVAVSILPGLRHTKDVASCAQHYHKLTMLHLPLEATQNFDFFYPSDYLIKTTMSSVRVSKILDGDLAQLPSIEGVNNHMGSKATADRSLMRIILKKLKEKELFFVDSVTSRYSVASDVAQELGLAYARRDVFLDNVNTREAITKQIMLLAKEARRRGHAVAIGHDRHLTMQVLKDLIPWLEKQGFKIVSIKELLKGKMNAL